MARTKFKSKIASRILLIILIIVITIGFFLVNRFPKHNSKSTNQQNSQEKTNSPTTQTPYNETSDFRYPILSGWSKLSQTALNSQGAISGIGHTSNPISSFSVKVSSNTPRNNVDQKDSTISELNKLSNFELLLYEETTVDGKTGQKFTYCFGDNTKTKQELIVIVYKQKTFFLLFSSDETDFNNQTTDFSKILSSFIFI